MKQETINKLKQNIEDLDFTVDKFFTEIYLLIATRFDSASSMDIVRDLIEKDNFQHRSVDYYIINTYRLLSGYDEIIQSEEEVESFRKNHLKDIESFVVKNFIKNSQVCIHSFNGEFRDSVAQNGLTKERVADKDILYLQEVLNKINLYFGFLNDSVGYINTSRIPTPARGIIEYAKSSPEWFESFLTDIFGIDSKEYAERDIKSICCKTNLWIKKERKSKRLSEKEINNIEELTNKYIFSFLSCENPCLAVINEETPDLLDANVLLADDQERLYQFLFLKKLGEMLFKEDIPREKISIIQLPIYNNVQQENDLLIE